MTLTELTVWIVVWSFMWGFTLKFMLPPGKEEWEDADEECLAAMASFFWPIFLPATLGSRLEGLRRKRITIKRKQEQETNRLLAEEGLDF